MSVEASEQQQDSVQANPAPDTSSTDPKDKKTQQPQAKPGIDPEKKKKAEAAAMNFLGSTDMGKAVAGVLGINLKATKAGDPLDELVERMMNVALCPGDAQRRKYQLLEFDGKANTAEYNVRQVVQHYLDDKTLQISEAAKKAILDNIPKMVGQAHIRDGQFDAAKLKSELSGFIRSNGGAQIHYTIAADDMKPHTLIKDKATDYSVQIDARKFEKAFNQDITLTPRGAGADFHRDRSVTPRELLSGLGAKDFSEVKLQAVYRVNETDKAVGGSVDGKEKSSYVDGYMVSKGDKRFYISSDSLDLQKVGGPEDKSGTPLAIKELYLMEAPETAPGAAPAAAPAPAAPKAGV